MKNINLREKDLDNVKGMVIGNIADEEAREGREGPDGVEGKH